MKLEAGRTPKRNLVELRIKTHLQSSPAAIEEKLDDVCLEKGSYDNLLIYRSATIEHIWIEGKGSKGTDLELVDTDIPEDSLEEGGKRLVDQYLVIVKLSDNDQDVEHAITVYKDLLASFKDISILQLPSTGYPLSLSNIKKYLGTKPLR